MSNNVRVKVVASLEISQEEVAEYANSSPYGKEVYAMLLHSGYAYDNIRAVYYPVGPRGAK